MNEDILPQTVVYLNKQLDGGMPTSSLDDELIQRNETHFFPTTAALPFITNAQENCRRLKALKA